MEAAETSAQTLPETDISPPSRWSPLRLGELWAHRELIYFLTKRELQVRYRQSVFGISWAILQPLAFAFVLALFFGQIAQGVFAPSGIPYAVFAVIGLVPWLFMANAIQASAGSLVLDAELISKIYFPRLALPISKALSLGVDLVIALVVVIFITVLYGITIPSTVVLVPAFLLLGLVTAFGVSTLFAALNVKYRDVTVLVPMLVQIGFFITPVLYAGAGSTSLVKGDWVYLWALNPMISVINGIRWALVGLTYPGTAEILISTASAAVLLVVALRYFRRAEQWFADVI